MSKNLYSLILAGLLATGVAARAQSTITYDWTETGSSYGNGSGTLTVDAASDVGPDSNHFIFAGNGYDYSVLSFTGTLGGAAITFDGTDLYFSDFSSDTLPGGSLLDESITFTKGSIEYSLYNVDADLASPAAISGYSTPGADAGNDVFTLTPVPEPGSLALAAVGGLALLGWRKRNAR